MQALTYLSTILLALTATVMAAPSANPAEIEKRGCGANYGTRAECAADCTGTCEANSVSMTSFSCACVSTSYCFEMGFADEK